MNEETRRPAPPNVGEPAPDFALPAAGGTVVRLSDFRGQKVVLYFYPKDDTPGCTREAIQFRDLHPTFTGLGAVVLGVSPDPIESHEKFRTKYDLPFLLLSDADHAVAERYGVWQRKVRFGRESMGIVRSTFLIDEAGRIARRWLNVKVDGHGEEVRQAIEAMENR
ncbi:peroxiredoxin [Hydrogenibacillus schlegelii]|uniref:thioredoxin-dependent peroxiredoxin n=1 Tax=Hydrogenibacillus schlegelii TaxID=1484 RepID=A0A132MGT3_HYDSH|nr:peroxiredoxin [Hydrogenibacillus schlegelii]KWW97060.1 peroxiredoxin [Hydrogenibacillus schlegelii]OAR03383.1 peroxiredoxin [Hydrogenibacillus schlegelii]PTQ51543.1 MAG: Thiol peroxidase, Bcp-type [Hydrogenibacillus schlegelii]